MELDDAYANAAHIAGADDYPPRWARDAAAFREGLLEQGLADLDISYGDSPRQRLDLFMPGAAPRGLMVFVHGGYWLRFDKSTWSHLAGGALSRGWAVAVPSYDLCPDVAVADITGQIARAVVVASDMVAGPVALSGHSAGGHLVARMVVPGVLPAHVTARLSHVAPISPVADLRPLLRTSMNAQLGLDPESAAAESPVLMRPAPGVEVSIWVGGDERPAFIDQAGWLAEAWNAPRIVVPGRHHFDVIDALRDPESDLVTRLTG